MAWQDESAVKERLASSRNRQAWAAQGAAARFGEIAERLPEPLRDKSRVGPMAVEPMEGVGGEPYVWVVPLDGSKFQGILLGPRNHVKLFDEEGNVFFDGAWGETEITMIERRERFYIWLEPTERRSPKVFRIGAWLLALAIGLAAPKASAEEAWKGAPPPTSLSLAAMAGAGVLDSAVGFGLNGAVGIKILNEGFIPDINDQVYLEGQFGVTFMRGSSVIPWGLFLRWDFHKDEALTLYSLGGLGGTITSAALGSRTLFYPRVALGVVWRAFGDIGIRAEVSHEFAGAGVVVDLGV